MLPGLETGLTSLRGFRDSQEKLRGGSREMNSAAKRSTSALDRLIGELEQSESYVIRIVSLCDDRLAEFDNEDGGERDV